MTNPSDAAVSDIVNDFLSVGYTTLSIGNRPVEISIPTLDVIFDGEQAAQNARNLAVVTAYASTSPTLSQLAQNSPPGTRVNVIIEYGDFGQISGELRSNSKPGFGSDSWIVKIYVDDTKYGYQTEDGGITKFTLQHLLNHELAHAFTENAPDSEAFLDLVNKINSETEAGSPRNLDYEIPPIHLDSCFLAGTMIDMWPLDPDIKPDASGLYDEAEVLAKVWKKPVEEVTPEDRVVSFDKRNNLKPGRVTQTMTNEVKIVLDFHGTFVTPGHVYYRKDSQKPHPFEPLIDILRDDGIIMHRDGRQIHAATNCEAGSEGDRELWAFTVFEDQYGNERVKSRKKIRLGTRWMLPNGDHLSVLDFLRTNDMEVVEEGDLKGYVRRNKEDITTLFVWPFSDTLPNPEDFVLQRSQTTLEDIYAAGEWEEQRPEMPAPMVMDGGPVQPLPESEVQKMAHNTPIAFVGNDAGQRGPNFSNRKQRKAQQARQRKAARAAKRILH